MIESLILIFFTSYLGIISLLHLSTGIEHRGLPLLVTLDVRGLLLVAVWMKIRGRPMSETLVPHGNVIMTTGKTVFSFALLKIVFPASFSSKNSHQMSLTMKLIKTQKIKDPFYRGKVIQEATL